MAPTVHTDCSRWLIVRLDYTPGGQAYEGVLVSSVNVEERFPGPCCWTVMYTCVLSSPSCELVYVHTQSPEAEASPS
jgi:hypothetical protein